MPMNLSSVGWKTEPKTFSYDWKNVVLYALGIGATVDELDYLYEGRGPKVYPTFAVVPVLEHVYQCLQQSGAEMASVVHGAQTVRVLGQMPPQGTLTTQAEIAAIHDAKRLAFLTVRTATTLVNGPPLFETIWSVIVRGEGGFGGPPPPKTDDVRPPADVLPDFAYEHATRPEQSLLYRLSGDINPLHADPQVAQKAGFDRGPILHGLATFGFAGRALVREACSGDASRLKAIHGQFRRPVWPGETLLTRGWHVQDRVVFQVVAKERNEVVMSNAWALIEP